MLSKYKYLSVIADSKGHENMSEQVAYAESLGWKQVGTRAYEVVGGIKMMYQAMVRPC